MKSMPLPAECRDDRAIDEANNAMSSVRRFGLRYHLIDDRACHELIKFWGEPRACIGGLAEINSNDKLMKLLERR